jgi:hypothetical protein
MNYTVYTRDWDLVQVCDTKEEARELISHLHKTYPDISRYYRIEAEPEFHQFDPRGE